MAHSIGRGVTESQRGQGRISPHNVERQREENQQQSTCQSAPFALRFLEPIATTEALSGKAPMNSTSLKKLRFHRRAKKWTRTARHLCGWRLYRTKPATAEVIVAANLW